MADEPELQPGAQNEWVTYLQQMLTHIGVYEGMADGSFGDLTNASVEALQQHYSIDEGGVVGEQTWKLLAMAREKPGEDVGFEQLDSDVATTEAPEFETEETA
jgi:peptidoglycan hydrolase-like protein with peptidoglycan-binding domain